MENCNPENTEVVELIPESSCPDCEQSSNNGDCNCSSGDIIYNGNVFLEYNITSNQTLNEVINNFITAITNIINGTMLPTATDSQTLRYDGGGAAWVATSFFYNTASAVGIGTQSNLYGALTAQGASTVDGANVAYFRNSDDSFNLYYSNAGNIKRNGSLFSLNPANGNNSWGIDALNLTLSGTDNNAFGLNTGKVITTASGSSLFGRNAGALITTGGSNSAFGYYSLPILTIGDSNSFYGSNSGFRLTSGTRNSGVGVSVLQTLTTGTNNNAVGYNCGLYLTTGSFNDFLGYTAGQGLDTSSSFNIAIGGVSGYRTTAAVIANSTYIGYNTYAHSSSEMVIGGAAVSYFLGKGKYTDAPVAITLQPNAPAAGDSGYFTPVANTAGAQFTIYGMPSTGSAAGGILALGTSPLGAAGTTLNAGVVRMAIQPGGTIGMNNGITAVTGSQLYVVGLGTSSATDSGYFRNSNNSFSIQFRDDGSIARNGFLWSRFHSTSVTSWGYLAGNANASAVSNTYFGSNAGLVNTGNSNAFFGHNAGLANTSGFQSTFIGIAAGAGITTGVKNTTVGYHAGEQLGTAGTGNENVVIGNNCARYVLGDNNVFMGGELGMTGFLAGSNNIILSPFGLLSSNNVNGCVILGVSATADGRTNSIGIGYGVVLTEDNQFVIGSTSAPVTNIYFGNGATNASPSDYNIHGVSGNGTDIGGGDMIFNVGQSTGAGVSGDIIWKYAATGSTGSSLNALATGMTFKGATGALELASSLGYLLLHRLTTAQRDALTAVNGMVIYNSTLNKFQGYENGAWTSFI